MKYYVMRPVRDDYGKVTFARENLRSYALTTAKRKADACGGYVCPLGKVAPVYVGVAHA